MGSHERSSSKWPSIGDAIHAVVAGMHIVMVINIVMVESDVMGVTLSSIFEGEFLAILGVVFEAAIIHDEPFWFISHALFMLAISGFISKHWGDLS